MGHYLLMLLGIAPAEVNDGLIRYNHMVWAIRAAGYPCDTGGLLLPLGGDLYKVWCTTDAGNELLHYTFQVNIVEDSLGHWNVHLKPLRFRVTTR